MSTTEEPLTSVWQGTFKLFGVDVTCHVLSDGRRIIEADSVARMFAAQADIGHEPVTPDGEREMTAFGNWLKGIA